MRSLTWAATLPLAGASVLVGHNLTYRLVGEPGNGLHDYLRHAPQLVAILATVGLLGLAVDQRAGRSHGSVRVSRDGGLRPARSTWSALFTPVSSRSSLADRAFILGDRFSRSRSASSAFWSHVPSRESSRRRSGATIAVADRATRPAAARLSAVEARSFHGWPASPSAGVARRPFSVLSDLAARRPHRERTERLP